MRVINFDYNKVITKSRPLIVYVFSDTHIGNMGTDEKWLKKNIQMCKNENANWLHLGDWCEAVAPRDKRFDIRTCKNPILEQYDRAIELFEPIKDKGICILTGNHDEKIAKEHGDYVAMVSKRLNIPYMGYATFINFRFWIQKRTNPNMNYVVFAHHGYGGGRKIGSKVNNIQDLSGSFDAELYLVGHTHTYNSHKNVIMGICWDKDNISKLQNRYKRFVICPAYIDGYKEQEVSSYIEKKGYQPQAIGCVRLEFYRVGNKIDVKVEEITR